MVGFVVVIRWELNGWFVGCMGIGVGCVCGGSCNNGGVGGRVCLSGGCGRLRLRGVDEA